MLDKTESKADIATLMADIGQRAKAAARPLAIASTGQKNSALNAMADAISARRQDILDANALDVEAALKGSMAGSFVDRLKLDDARIDGITDGIRTACEGLGHHGFPRTCDGGRRDAAVQGSQPERGG